MTHEQWDGVTFSRFSVETHNHQTLEAVAPGYFDAALARLMADDPVWRSPRVKWHGTRAVKMGNSRLRVKGTLYFRLRVA